MKIVLATSNPGKVKEIQKLLGSSNHEIIRQAELGIQDAIENGDSFEANALIKARHASKQSALPAIADDSGLCVDCLNGEPGLYSARYAGENATDQQNIDKLLERLEDVPENSRNAHFQCIVAMVMSDNDPDPIICRGIWQGRISRHPSGDNGFGYDPVFYIPEMDCTSAELCPEIKNKYSHRAQALKKLVMQLL